MGLPDFVAVQLTSFNIPAYGVLGLICVMYIIAGCFLEPTGLMVITVPILFPAAVALGFDPIWFGVLVVLNMETANITPP